MKVYESVMGEEGTLSTTALLHRWTERCGCWTERSQLKQAAVVLLVFIVHVWEHYSGGPGGVCYLSSVDIDGRGAPLLDRSLSDLARQPSKTCKNKTDNQIPHIGEGEGEGEGGRETGSERERRKETEK